MDSTEIESHKLQLWYILVSVLSALSLVLYLCGYMWFTIWVLIWVPSTFLLNGLQWVSLLFWPCSKYLFRLWNRQLGKAWANILITLTAIFYPTTFILRGEKHVLQNFLDNGTGRRVLIMCNHQSFMDWWLLWNLAYMVKRAEDVKFILRGDIKWVPIYGWGCQFFEFIFVNFGKFRGASGTAPLVAAIKSSCSSHFPVWVAIYPEGTLVYPANVAKSKAYAEKMGLPYPYQEVLMPKVAGLRAVLNELPHGVDTLLDVTFGYGDYYEYRARSSKEEVALTGGGKVLDWKKYPFDVVPLPQAMWNSPRRHTLHVHMRAYSLDSIPGLQAPLVPPSATSDPAAAAAKPVPEDRSLFGCWLRDRFLEKDLLMRSFYETGAFPDSVPAVVDGESVAAGAGAAAAGGVVRSPETLSLQAAPRWRDVLLRVGMMPLVTPLSFVSALLAGEGTAAEGDRRR